MITPHSPTTGGGRRPVSLLLVVGGRWHILAGGRTRRAASVVLVVLALWVCISPTIPAAAADAGPRIFFQSLAPAGGDTLYTMRPNGTDVRRLPLNIEGSAISPDWSPDGRQVVFVVQDPEGVQSLWVADATGADARELVPCGAGCLSLDYPAWSPDGRFIAFTHYDADPPPTAGPPAANSLRVLDPRSGRQRVIARSTFPELLDLPRWPPDGRHLVAQIDRFAADGTETGSRIATVRVRDGHVLLLTPFSRFAFHPDWSVRNLIVFATYDFFVDPPRHRTSNIVTIRPDGTQERQLTRIRPGNDRVGQPTFTPDGQ